MGVRLLPARTPPIRRNPIPCSLQPRLTYIKPGYTTNPTRRTCPRTTSNTASGYQSSVTGGYGNTASGLLA